MKKNIVIATLAVLLFAIVAGIVIAFCLPGNLTEEERIAKLRDSSVMIHVDGASGSGVIVKKTEEAVFIVTCAHLMTEYDQGIVTLVNGMTIFGDVVSFSEEKDLCILKVRSEYIDEDLYAEMKPADISKKAFKKLKKDDEVYIAGSALAVGSNIVKGEFKEKEYYVPEFDMEMLYIYAETMPGLSGCGVFDKDGNLIGILAGGSDNAEAVCVSLDDVLSEMEDL
jgi:S1-C subfamily serine protease